VTPWELELATALRLEAAVVLIFLAARCGHLGQTVVALGLAGGAYAHEGLAIGLGLRAGSRASCSPPSCLVQGDCAVARF
jgi:hypothetical protein